MGAFGAGTEVWPPSLSQRFLVRCSCFCYCTRHLVIFPLILSHRGSLDDKIDFIKTKSSRLCSMLSAVFSKHCHSGSATMNGLKSFGRYPTSGCAGRTSTCTDFHQQSRTVASKISPPRNIMSVRGRISTFQADLNKALRLRLHQSCFVLHSDYSYSTKHWKS